MSRRGTVTTRFAARFLSDSAAAAWIVRAASTEGMSAQYIALRDFSRDAGEGNASRQLDAAATADEIAARLRKSPCDRLFLSGRYGGASVGLGVDLRSFEIAVTVPADRPELAGEIMERVGQ